MKREFAGVPGVKEFADKQESEEAKDRRNTLDKYKEFELLSGNNGAICQYEWEYKGINDFGLLVLKDGDIVKRDSWGVVYPSEEAMTNVLDLPR